MPRGPYNTVTTKDHQRILSAYKEDQDWLLLATQLGIKRQTARNIVRIFLKDNREHALPKDGKGPKLLDASMIQCLVDFLGNKATATTFGCNIWTVRTKGRSFLGERAVRVVEGQRGPNLTASSVGIGPS